MPQGERENLAFGVKPVDIAATTLVWSDHAHYAHLDHYINLRRPSTHKQFFEAQKQNASTGAVVRIEELSDVSGSIYSGHPDYVKDEATGDYSYNLYDTALAVLPSTVSDGKMYTMAKKYDSASASYKSTKTTGEFYIGGTYKGNLSLYEAVNAGKATFGKDPIALTVYKFDGKTNINALLLATGGVDAKYTSRKYDIFISDSMDDIFEDYNKIFSL